MNYSEKLNKKKFKRNNLIAFAINITVVGILISAYVVVKFGFIKL